MQLSEENKKTLLVNLHKQIEESANTAAKAIYHGKLDSLINYPSNGGLTEAEKNALIQLKGNELLMTGLRKLFASNTADVFFSFFNMVDGTADPDPGTGDWSEVMLIDKPGDFDADIEFLHDDFYSTYWEWKDRRYDNSWSLDISE